MAILKPDKIVKKTIGKYTIEIKEKIIPDTAKATKNVASWCKKGDPMKPCAKLNNGTGKPRGITVHNTSDIKVASGTNPAEQYTRATYPNCNMGGVVVHFYVYKSEIWQNLKLNEQGWHATDGASRRKSHRSGQTIGGNIDTIAIECIGNLAESEETTAKLVAWLCKEYGLDPSLDVYTHNYFYPSKKCPEYILPHWGKFLEKCKTYYNSKAQTATAPSTTKPSTANPPKTDNSFLVKIVCNSLYIRSKPSIMSAIRGSVKKGQVYTIVQTSGNWGKLKSGAGWISIKSKYVSRVK